MAVRSGSGKASLMLANETRSGLRDREDNGQLLPGEKRRVRAVLRIGTDEGGDDDGTTVDQGSAGARRPRGITESKTRRRTATVHLIVGRAWIQPLWPSSAERAVPGVPDRVKVPSPAVKDPGQRARSGRSCPPAWPPDGDYLISTVAPAPSRAALALSASSLLAFSRTGLGA